VGWGWVLTRRPAIVFGVARRAQAWIDRDRHAKAGTGALSAF